MKITTQHDSTAILDEIFKQVKDRFDPLDEELLPKLERSPKMKSDYVHFNRKGYAKMAEEFIHFFKILARYPRASVTK